MNLNTTHYQPIILNTEAFLSLPADVDTLLLGQIPLSTSSSATDRPPPADFELETNQQTKAFTTLPAGEEDTRLLGQGPISIISSAKDQEIPTEFHQQTKALTTMQEAEKNTSKDQNNHPQRNSKRKATEEIDTNSTKRRCTKGALQIPARQQEKTDLTSLILLLAEENARLLKLLNESLQDKQLLIDLLKINKMTQPKQHELLLAQLVYLILNKPQ